MPTLIFSAHEQTLKNLLAAFDDESNVAARYAAFAVKADEERYFKVGSLFRAASRAEHIHAANHSAAIQKLGGMADAEIFIDEVKSTMENLQAAIAGELHEAEVMYPGFIREAEAQERAAALRTFKYAIEAEKEHAWFFTMALEHILRAEHSCRRLSNKAIYFVCPGCGFITDKTEFDRCPTCDQPKEQFEVIT